MVIGKIAAWTDLQPPTSPGQASQGVAPARTPSERSTSPKPASGQAAQQAGRDGRGGELLLTHAVDFRILTENLKDLVLGHDAITDSVVNQIQRNLQLRAGSPKGTRHAPLCACFFVGPSGYGKRYLARQIGARVYKSGSILFLDMKEYAHETQAVLELFGGRPPAGGGRIITEVRSKPYHTIILENIDKAPSQVVDKLHRILSDGVFVDESSGASVDFQHCLLFLISHREIDTSADSPATSASPAVLAQRVASALATFPAFGKPLLAAVPDLHYFGPLSAILTARVLAMLMRQECSKYGVILERVAPELLVEETAALGDDGHGLETAPAKVSRLLREPIVKITTRGQRRLQLTREQEPPEK